MKTKVLKTLSILALIFTLTLGLFAYRNLTYAPNHEDFLEKKGYALGFTEHTVSLEDGSEMSYLEGPDHGPCLLLLHGQQVTSKDYAKVLPSLSKDFHIYAPDYYGHGKSSKDPDKYSAVAIGEDLVWFLKNVIQDKAYIAGHSSGALLAAYVSAHAPEDTMATILEDGPFFSTLPGRAEKTISWLSFQTMHDYLQKEPTTSFMAYSLDHDYMQEVFNAQDPHAWDTLVKGPAMRCLTKHPDQVPKIWYYPPEIGINALYALNANLQDGTGPYDLRFGATFYDFSWFDGFDQETILKSIQAPTLVLHVAPNKVTAPGYYDQKGILLAAMDEKDAQRVVDLVPNATYIGGFPSDHNIHADLPKDYVAVLCTLKDRIDGSIGCPAKVNTPPKRIPKSTDK